MHARSARRESSEANDPVAVDRRRLSISFDPIPQYDQFTLVRFERIIANLPGAVGPRQAVERFLGAANSQDIQEMSIAWGYG
jgi:hypothetical protein